MRASQEKRKMKCYHITGIAASLEKSEKASLRREVFNLRFKGYIEFKKEKYSIDQWFSKCGLRSATPAWPGNWWKCKFWAPLHTSWVRTSAVAGGGGKAQVSVFVTQNPGTLMTLKLQDHDPRYRENHKWRSCDGGGGEKACFSIKKDQCNGSRVTGGQLLEVRLKRYTRNILRNS